MSAPKTMTRPRMLNEAANYKSIRHRAAYTAKAMMWHKGDRNRYCGAYYTGGCPTCFAANTMINFFFDAPMKDVRAVLAAGAALAQIDATACAGSPSPDRAETSEKHLRAYAWEAIGDV